MIKSLGLTCSPNRTRVQIGQQKHKIWWVWTVWIRLINIQCCFLLKHCWYCGTISSHSSKYPLLVCEMPLPAVQNASSIQLGQQIANSPVSYGTVFINRWFCSARFPSNDGGKKNYSVAMPSIVSLHHTGITYVNTGLFCSSWFIQSQLSASVCPLGVKKDVEVWVMNEGNLTQYRPAINIYLFNVTITNFPSH